MVVMRLLILLIFLLPTSTNAKEFVDINTVSYHFDRNHAKNLNEINLGFGYENESDKIRNMVGVYRNSFRRTTAYALHGYSAVKTEQVSVGVVGGLATGYIWAISPVTGGIFTYQNGPIGFNITSVPPIAIRGHKLRGFTALQLRFRLR